MNQCAHIKHCPRPSVETNKLIKVSVSVQKHTKTIFLWDHIYKHAKRSGRIHKYMSTYNCLEKCLKGYVVNHWGWGAGTRNR